MSWMNNVGSRGSVTLTIPKDRYEELRKNPAYEKIFAELVPHVEQSPNPLAGRSISYSSSSTGTKIHTLHDSQFPNRHLVRETAMLACHSQAQKAAANAIAKSSRSTTEGYNERSSTSGHNRRPSFDSMSTEMSCSQDEHNSAANSSTTAAAAAAAAAAPQHQLNRVANVNNAALPTGGPNPNRHPVAQRNRHANTVGERSNTDNFPLSQLIQQHAAYNYNDESARYSYAQQAAAGSDVSARSSVRSTMDSARPSTSGHARHPSFDSMSCSQDSSSSAEMSCSQESTGSADGHDGAASTRTVAAAAAAAPQRESNVAVIVNNTASGPSRRIVGQPLSTIVGGITPPAQVAHIISASQVAHIMPASTDTFYPPDRSAF